MATRKRKRGKPDGFRDGVRKRDDGLWDLRINWTDKATKILFDTIKVVEAASRGDAISQREKELNERRAPTGLGLTLQEALDNFLPTIDRLSTRLSWTSQGKKIAKVFGKRRLASIEPIEIQRFLQELPGSDATAAQVRKVFRSLYVHVKKIGAYGGRNPTMETVRRSKPTTAAERMAVFKNPPKRAYLGDEAQRFLDALPEDVRPLQELQLYLGCRFGEVSALEWTDIDMDTGVVTIMNNQVKGVLDLPKGDEPRKSALGPRALAMLRAHRLRMAEMQWPGWERLVFPRPTWGDDRRHNYWDYGTVRRWIKIAQKTIGSEVVNVTHAMRHTHITLAEVNRQLQVDAEMARLDAERHKKMTGHSSDKQRDQYVDKRALPASRIAAEIEGIITSNQTKPEK